MVEETYTQIRDRLYQQTISKQVSIATGAEGSLEIDVPNGTTAFLKGYGYDFFTGCTFYLETGEITFPARTDQEGSYATPVVYDNPFPIRTGGKVKLRIVNASGSTLTFNARFLILTNKMINTISTGKDLAITTTSNVQQTQSLGTLTEAGTQTTAYSVLQGTLSHIFAVTIANIVTNVIVRYEGSIDGTNWFNLDTNESDTTYTANGTYSATYNGTLKQVRVNFVTETGGTSATIACNYLGV